MQLYKVHQDLLLMCFKLVRDFSVLVSIEGIVGFFIVLLILVALATLIIFGAVTKRIHVHISFGKRGKLNPKKYKKTSFILAS